MLTCLVLTYPVHILCSYIPCISCAHITHAHISCANIFHANISHANISHTHMPFISYAYICHPCICFLSAYFSSLDVYVFQPMYFSLHISILILILPLFFYVLSCMRQ